MSDWKSSFNDSPMRVTGSIPEFETEHWRVERFAVNDREDKLMQLSSMFSPGGRYCPPGEYTRLWRLWKRDERDRRTLVMSDTPDEIRDHSWPLHRARGRVLINGLGLGCVLKGVLQKRAPCPTCHGRAYNQPCKTCFNVGQVGEYAVDHVDVVEVSGELVEAMVEHAPWCRDERVTFHVADALEMRWPPNTRWDLAWHDIWNELTTDNLETYARLNRMYGRRVGRQGAWGQELLRDMRRRGW